MHADVKMGSDIDMMAILPPEVIDHIAEHLSALDVLNLGGTDKRTAGAIDDELAESRSGAACVRSIMGTCRAEADQINLFAVLNESTALIECAVKKRQPEFLRELSRIFVTHIDSAISYGMAWSIRAALAPKPHPQFQKMGGKVGVSWIAYLDCQTQKAQIDYAQGGAAKSVADLYQAWAYMPVFGLVKADVAYWTTLLGDVEKLPVKYWPAILDLVLRYSPPTSVCADMIDELVRSYDATFSDLSDPVLIAIINVMLLSDKHADVRAQCVSRFGVEDDRLAALFRSIVRTLRYAIGPMLSGDDARSKSVLGDMMTRWDADDPGVPALFHDCAISNLIGTTLDQGRLTSLSSSEYEQAREASLLGFSRDAVLKISGPEGLYAYWEGMYFAKSADFWHTENDVLWRRLDAVPWQLQPVVLNGVALHLPRSMVISDPEGIARKVNACTVWECDISTHALESGLFRVGLRAIAVSLEWQARVHELSGKNVAAPYISTEGIALIKAAPATECQELLTMVARFRGKWPITDVIPSDEHSAPGGAPYETFLINRCQALIDDPHATLIGLDAMFDRALILAVEHLGVDKPANQSWDDIGLRLNLLPEAVAKLKPLG